MLPMLILRLLAALEMENSHSYGAVLYMYKFVNIWYIVQPIFAYILHSEEILACGEKKEAYTVQPDNYPNWVMSDR